MKSLVVYYSHTGHTQYVAEEIAKVTGSELLELKPIHDLTQNKLLKYVKGGFDAIHAKTVELEPYSTKLADFDTIILGTPVWGWHPTPAIRAFLQQEQLEGKQIALFCTHDGGAGKFFKRLKALLPAHKFIGEIDICKPRKGNVDAKLQKLIDWSIGLTNM